MSQADRHPVASRSGLKSAIAGGAVVVLLALMALDTRVVVIGSEADVQGDVFNPEAFGDAQFPAIRDSIETRAVAAADLAPEVQADAAAAGAKYGVGDGFGPVLPVTFTGVAGEGRSGIYPVTVEGMPEGIALRVQTGPAINGTELRDATGTIEFGQFTNQIEYQDAGAAINEAMKRDVLAGVDTSDLEGRTITVTGAFKLINPKNWLVTPVRLSVE